MTVVTWYLTEPPSDHLINQLVAFELTVVGSTADDYTWIAPVDAPNG